MVSRDLSLEPAPLATRLAGLLVAAVVVLAPATGWAGAFYLPGHGVRPMGRAGASVASTGGNLNAVWYNPANLALLEERTLTVDTSVIGTFATFQRAPRTTQSGETETYDAVSNEAFPVPDPQILIGGPTGLDGLSWAAGLWAPYSSYTRYPEGGAQRYSSIGRSGSVLAYLGGSVGYQISDSLRIGAGIQNMVADLDLVAAVSGYTGVYGRPEDRSLDVLARLEARDLFIPTGNLGVWYAINDAWQTALSAQIPTRMADDDAEFEIRKGSHPSFDEVEVSNNTVSVGAPLPLILRGALRYRAERFDLELAAVFEGWSVYDEITIDPNNVEVRDAPGVGTVTVEPIGLQRDWRNSLSLRLGGDYQVASDWTVRAGYGFETSAIPKAYLDVLVLDAPKHTISGGFSYDWGRWQLDGSAAFIAHHPREVTNSRVTQISPMDVDDELATVVGNGTYKVSHLTVGAGINWQF